MKHSELIEQIIRIGTKKGAAASEVLLREGLEFSTVVRLGVVEKLAQAGFRKVGVRMFRGSRSALFATSDFSLESLGSLIEDTLAMASAAGEESAAGLPALQDYDRPRPSTILCFEAGASLSVSEKIALAARCEEGALKSDPRITNTEGASFTNSITHFAYGNSCSIVGEYSRSIYSLSATALAEANGRKQRDFWLSTHPDFCRLEKPEEIGCNAAMRTLRRLGARKGSTCSVPVVFDPLASASLLKHVAVAVSGTTLLRKASFLMGMLGKKVASSGITLIDNALLGGGLGSRLFDSEGIASQSTVVVRDGILENYLLDSYAARKLGLKSTANSDRELHGGPTSGPSNFYLQPGTASPEDLIASVRNGLYVTELIGFGVDTVSGNYSQGAVGVWIENGRLAYPVEEITIAGNLKEILTSIEGVGNDPVIQGEVFAPTLLIAKMAVSGS